MSFLKKAQVPKPRGTKTTAPVARRTPVPGKRDYGNGSANLTGGNGSANLTNNSGSIVSNSVKEMQKAILNFAAKAEQTSATNLQGKGKEDNAQGQHLGGTDPFGNFLVQNYLGDHTDVGKQYLNTDVSGEKNRSDNSIKNQSLKGLIDTIKRIGTPGTVGTEKAADGIWQSRTNNALKNIYAVAYAMLHAAEDMDLTLPSLDSSTLESFKSLIPDSYTDLSVNERSERASQLTPMINKIAGMFEGFKNYVLNNQKYKEYIEQEKSFISYDKKPASGDALLNDEEKSFYTKYREAEIPNVKIDNVLVSLNDLEDMNRLKALMARAGRKSDDPADVARTVAEISKALGGQAPTDNPNATLGF